MSDALLPLEPSDELRRLTLASSLRDAALAQLERAIARERAQKAALLEAAKAVADEPQLQYHSGVRRLRAAIAEAEKKAV